MLREKVSTTARARALRLAAAQGHHVWYMYVRLIGSCNQALCASAIKLAAKHGNVDFVNFILTFSNSRNSNFTKTIKKTLRFTKNNNHYTVVQDLMANDEIMSLISI